MIFIRKEKYHDHLLMKLNTPRTSSKPYWSILKSYKDPEIPLISPVFVKNKTVSDFTEKPDLFNILLLHSTHLTPINNGSVLILIWPCQN